MGKPSPAEPVSQLRSIKIVDNGEPLIDLRTVCDRIEVEPQRFIYRREWLLRTSVAERLNRACYLLPSGYRIGVLEGWRAPHIQKRMYDAIWNRLAARYPHLSPVQLKRVVNRYSAPLDPRVPPPHMTGGAMDVFLWDDQGNALDMRSPFEGYDPLCFAFNAAGLCDAARKHRDILATALDKAGITNYPSEFWHHSYGDQGWAYRGGHPNALYGSVTPADWSADPADLIPDPLALVEETG